MQKTAIKNICVFCGASSGHHSDYSELAQQLGCLLAQQKRRLIYGGGNRGLMGIVANTALAHGGEVVGIIPEKLLVAETAHHGITQLEIVADMHSRKARMMELADGFIAMPGGIGTFEELFEAWTWGQIGYHHKPIGLLDANHFYQPLYRYLHYVAQEGFLMSDYLETLYYSNQPAELLMQFDDYQPKEYNRWSKS